MVLEDCVIINFILYYKIFLYFHLLLSSNIVMESFYFLIIIQLQFNINIINNHSYPSNHNHLNIYF